jgi:hyaluronate lyase
VVQSALRIQAVYFGAASPRPVAGITADAVASVLAHQAGGLLSVSVADPTQANNGVIHIEIGTPVSAVVSQDEGVTVDQTSPTVRLSVNVKGALGKAFRASLSLDFP